MTNHDFERIEERLVPPAAADPPSDLLEKIQRDIPEYLTVVPDLDEAAPRRRGLRLIAASVALAAVGGTVAYQLVRQAPTLEDRLLSEIDDEARVIEEIPAPATEAEPVSETPATPPTPARPQESISKVGDLEVAGKRATGDLRVRSDQPTAVEPRREVAQRQSNAIAESPPPATRDLRPTEEVSAQEALADQGAVSSAVVETAPPAQAKLDTMAESDRVEAPARGRTHEKKHEDEGLRALGYIGSRATAEAPPARFDLSPTAPPSTGGTAEPNDAPYGDMFFRAHGTNPFIDTEDDRFSTFGLDVDTGSFTLARSYLERGHRPPPEAIRVEEFVNYFDYADPAPRRGEFTLVAEGAPSPFADGPRYQLVRFGIKAREIGRAERKPAVLIFVVDVSGSMRREDRLTLVKRSLDLLLDELDHDDEIALVVYGSRGEVLLEPTRSKESIRRAIGRLVPGGSTNAEEGLDLAYELARRYYREGAIHRIILCSDGVANVGRTGPESILERVRVAAEDGIELTTVGFGMGNYNDALMEQLADQGDGSYAYVDSLTEARRVFVENLTGTLQTIAADAKAQVEFNPAAVSRYRLLGYENRDIADERFRDDTVDAGEIGAGHAVTALYEVKLVEGVGRRQRLATLRLRYRSKASDEVVESAIDLERRHLAASWSRASTAVQLSSLAAEFAEILKGSYWAKDGSLDDLHRRLRPVADELAGDERVEDLVYLVDRARRLPARSHPEIEE